MIPRREAAGWLFINITSASPIAWAMTSIQEATVVLAAVEEGCRGVEGIVVGGFAAQSCSWQPRLNLLIERMPWSCCTRLPSLLWGPWVCLRLGSNKGRHLPYQVAARCRVSSWPLPSSFPDVSAWLLLFCTSFLGSSCRLLNPWNNVVGVMGWVLRIFIFVKTRNWTIENALRW